MNIKKTNHLNINTFDKEQETVKRELLGDFINALGWHLPYITFFASFYAYVLSEYADITVLLIWYLVFLMSFVPVGFIYKRYKNNLDFDFIKIENQLVFLSSLGALIMSASSWLFFHHFPQNTVIFMIAMLALCPAVSVASFTHSIKLWLGINLCLMLPILIFVYFNLHTEAVSSITLSFWLLIYTIYMFFIARVQHQNSIEKLLLRRQAEKAEQDKSRFLAFASHDLRQPLHALGFFLDALNTEVKQTGKQVLAKAQASKKSLDELLNGLLDISKLDAGAVSIYNATIDIYALCIEVFNELSPLAAEKELNFSLTQMPNLFVYSDATLLKNIIVNLVSNAIKYTKQGDVNIELKQQNNQVLIAITDSGVGIEKNEYDNIFNEYYQINNTQRDRTNGLGLGLSIVRRQCQLLSIKLDLDSKLGKGSCFSLKLNLVNAPIKKSSTAPLLNLIGTKVLVIDDEADILSATQAILIAWQCEVIVALSANQALEKLQKQQVFPDVILSDYVLTDEQTGKQAIQAIREYAQEQIPAILITGDLNIWKSATLRDEFIILSKPVSSLQLHTALIQILD